MTDLLIVEHLHIVCILLFPPAVNNHWTGLLDWTTGLDYWTDQFYHKIHTCGLKTLVPELPAWR